MSPKQPRDRLRSQKKPFTQTVKVCMDADLAERRAEIEANLDELRQRRDSLDFMQREIPDDLARSIEDAEAQFEEIRPRVDETTEVFVFQSIGRKKFDRLLDEHPPTEQQKTDNKAKGLPPPEWNADSFGPAICFETCVSHDLDLDSWKAIFEDEAWNVAELTSLVNAAYTCNVSMRVVDMGKGSGGIRG